jgi:hypothetical protein
LKLVKIKEMLAKRNKNTVSGSNKSPKKENDYKSGEGAAVGLIRWCRMNFPERGIWQIDGCGHIFFRAICDIFWIFTHRTQNETNLAIMC